MRWTAISSAAAAPAALSADDYSNLKAPCYSEFWGTTYSRPYKFCQILVNSSPVQRPASPDPKLFNFAIGGTVLQCGGPYTRPGASPSQPWYYCFRNPPLYPDGSEASILPSSEVGTFLVFAWQADIKRFEMGLSYNASSIWDAFRSGLSAAFPAGTISAPVDSIGDYMTAGARQIRRPTWLTMQAGGGGGKAPDTWTDIYKNKDAVFPLTRWNNEGAGSIGGLSLMFSAMPRVEATQLNYKATGCYANFVYLSNTVASSGKMWGEDYTYHFIFGGPIGGKYTMDAPARYYEDEFVQSSGLLKGDSYYKMGPDYCPVIVCCPTGEGSSDEYIGRAGGWLICPINRDDVQELCNRSMLQLCNASMSEVEILSSPWTM